MLRIRTATDASGGSGPATVVLRNVMAAHYSITIASIHLLAIMLPANPPATRAGEVQFNRDVRPILSENCYACHGPDKNQRKAKLRLDVQEIALERGAIVPSKPGESKLLQHIFSNDPDEIMPPPKTQKKLTAAQKETLKEWIAEGAKYELHWSYIPLKRPPIPKVEETRWVRSPIDAFVLENLESKHIKPSPEADRRTLLRRLSLDLIGLPPTPEQVRAFLADSRPDAYEREVDRLLRSPHFGERMAVPWLDVVRFADTVGYHGDQNQNIFPYRDYVIDAFNRNKSFDQFTIEQLAGDLLPDPSIDAYVATGFNRLNMVTREGGAQAKEYLAKYAADRVRTVSMAWLGSTMGCAECHDHKFDPFSTRDFYSMEAFFADLKQWGVYENYGYTPEPELEGIDNDGPFPPEIEVDNDYLHQRLARLGKKLEHLYASSAAKLRRNPEGQRAFIAWRSSSLAFLKQWPEGWAAPTPEVALKLKNTNEVVESNFAVRRDGTVALTAQARESLKITLPLPAMWLAAIRVEVSPEKSDANEPRKKRKGNSIALAASIKSHDEETRLTYYDAEADHKQERYLNGHPVIGVKDAWRLSTEPGNQTAVWILNKPRQVTRDEQLVINPGNNFIGSLRITISPFASEDPLRAGGGPALKQKLERSGPDHSEPKIVSTYLLGTHWDEDMAGQVRQLIRDERLCRQGRTFTMVSVAREHPAITRILPRGNWQNETSEVVAPATPHFLPSIPNREGRRLTRLDLARWLVSKDNPLTPRAMVNRFWKQFFGTGLSAVVDDLGAQGDWPVYPELLDWLACEFRGDPPLNVSEKEHSPRQAWDVKHIIRTIVLSSTYRQGSNQRLDLKDVDPNNRLLAAQNPRRLEAEFVRDNALFIAGLLNLDLGGPSAFPYQPAGYYANIQFPDRDYIADRDEREYRRGLYIHWQRTFLHPMLANFDAPGREECTANRVVSNTPQQALTLLNDPSFVEAARVFALHLLRSSAGSDAQRLEAAYEQALSRRIRPKEMQSLQQFLSQQREHCRQHREESEHLMKAGLAPAPPANQQDEVAAWTEVCRVILNLHETITRY